MRKALESQIDSLDGTYEKITTIVMISTQEEEWHKEIDRSIEQMKNEINEIKVHHRDILKKTFKRDRTDRILGKRKYTHSGRHSAGIHCRVCNQRIQIPKQRTR